MGTYKRLVELEGGGGVSMLEKMTVEEDNESPSFITQGETKIGLS